MQIWNTEFSNTLTPNILVLGKSPFYQKHVLRELYRFRSAAVSRSVT